MIDIARIPKPALLAALVNHHPVSHSFTRALTPAHLIAALHPVATETEAARFLEVIGEQWPGTPEVRRYSVDYFLGRAIKSDLTFDEAEPRLYDRDAGEGAFAGVVAELRKVYP